MTLGSGTRSSRFALRLAKKKPATAAYAYGGFSPLEAGARLGRREAHQPCFLSKNCSSSVEPFKAAVEASRSMVVVTASK
jgi:hypothetical protein